jgi:transposase InsO family protein
MQVQGSSFTLRELCEWTGVSRASYYRRWQRHQPNEEKMAVRDRLQRLALKNRHNGYRTLTKLLRREGLVVNSKRVLRLMQIDNLLSIRRKRFVVTTQSAPDQQVYPNLARRMRVTGLDQLWVADITYVRLRVEFIYVAIVLDVCSRRVVGWSIGRKVDSRLAQDALRKAVQRRNPKPGLVHHSDRGWQYACGEYLSLLKDFGLEASMSRPGNPWDNAFAESFMKTLKSEEVDGRVYPSLEEARESIEEFIEGFYNTERLHSRLGYQSPIEFEATLTTLDVSNFDERGMLSEDGKGRGLLPPSLALPSPAQNNNGVI